MVDVSLAYSTRYIKKKIQEYWLIDLSLLDSSASVFRKYLEELINALPLILLCVIVWAMGLLARFTLTASMHFIVQRMVFLLFPAMRKLASIFMFAAISISLYEVFGFPLRALILFIVEYMRFSSKILPIMSIYTSISWMISITIRTPDSFKMEHIEVSIFLKFI